MKLLYLLLFPILCYCQTDLKILSINVWSGLDYEGIIKCGEYESAETREKRFNLLVEQIKKLAPDVIFLQEVNPVLGYSRRIANLLGYDEIHHLCNGGLKIGGIGIPINLNDGITILASPELRLQKYDVWKLSGPFGLYGSTVTMHFSEANFALVGKILYKSIPVILINTHLSDFPPSDSLQRLRIMNAAISKGTNQQELEYAIEKWNDRIEKKKEEFKVLEEQIEKFDTSAAYILGGDFNCLPEEKMLEDFILRMRITDCGNDDEQFTWDPQHNQNIKYSLNKSVITDGYALMNSFKDQWSKRLDYIFLSSHFEENDIKECKVVLDSIDEINVSDHYGVMATVNVSEIIKGTRRESIYFQSLQNTTIEPFPILMYDTDIGFGYGAKAFFLNTLGFSESFDLLAFNSSKGERWYRAFFSLPDLEARQGKVYPLSLDVTADYDKLIKNSFFGIGHSSEYSNREFYTKETFDFSIVLNRGFTPCFIGEIGTRYKSVSNSNIVPGGNLSRVSVNTDYRAYYFSLFAGVRYDSRNSFINPSEGMVIHAEIESSVKNISYIKTGLSVQNYNILFYPKTVLAARACLRSVSGDIPVQLLQSLGGNNTLRGYPQDRFMDKSFLLINGELRFPIVWRFGGLFGLDAGKVFNSLSAMDLKSYKYNLSAGIRFYMENFVVRLDAGFSKETTGLYFNFGHIF